MARCLGGHAFTPVKCGRIAQADSHEGCFPLRSDAVKRTYTLSICYFIIQALVKRVLSSFPFPRIAMFGVFDVTFGVRTGGQNMPYPAVHFKSSRNLIKHVKQACPSHAQRAWSNTVSMHGLRCPDGRGNQVNGRRGERHGKTEGVSGGRMSACTL